MVDEELVDRQAGPVAGARDRAAPPNSPIMALVLRTLPLDTKAGAAAARAGRRAAERTGTKAAAVQETAQAAMATGGDWGGG